MGWLQAHLIYCEPHHLAIRSPEYCSFYPRTDSELHGNSLRPSTNEMFPPCFFLFFFVCVFLVRRLCLESLFKWQTNTLATRKIQKTIRQRFGYHRTTIWLKWILAIAIIFTIIGRDTRNIQTENRNVTPFWIVHLYCSTQKHTATEFHRKIERIVGAGTQCISNH